jgi:hypothetical protein
LASRPSLIACLVCKRQLAKQRHQLVAPVEDDNVARLESPRASLLQVVHLKKKQERKEKKERKKEERKKKEKEM